MNKMIETQSADDFSLDTLEHMHNLLHKAICNPVMADRYYHMALWLAKLYAEQELQYDKILRAFQNILLVESASEPAAYI